MDSGDTFAVASKRYVCGYRCKGEGEVQYCMFAIKCCKRFVCMAPDDNRTRGKPRPRKAPTEETVPAENRAKGLPDSWRNRAHGIPSPRTTASTVCGRPHAYDISEYC
jgi:hypothetical protein